MVEYEEVARQSWSGENLRSLREMFLPQLDIFGKTTTVDLRRGSHLQFTIHERALPAVIRRFLGAIL